MTSPRASSTQANRGRKFEVAVEIDEAQIRRMNAALLRLPTHLSQKAIRRAFSKWARGTKRKVEQAAPLGPVRPTEWVRGAERPNPHLKFNVATKLKTYRRELVQWVGVGIREIKGSYLTPHWYLRWVERGHSTYRPIGNIPKMRRGRYGWVKPTDWEQQVSAWAERNAAEIDEARRGGTISRRGFSRRVSFVRGNPFITRTARVAAQIIAPMVESEVDKTVREYRLG